MSGDSELSGCDSLGWARREGVCATVSLGMRAHTLIIEGVVWVRSRRPCLEGRGAVGEGGMPAFRGRGDGEGLGLGGDGGDGGAGVVSRDEVVLAGGEVLKRFADPFSGSSLFLLPFSAAFSAARFVPGSRSSHPSGRYTPATGVTFFSSKGWQFYSGTIAVRDAD
jgi:hypothetical protein